MAHQPLEFGVIYHIYNRGNNGETIFPEERNYKYFMQLYGKYIAPIADTFAYCLLRNHFHFLVRIKDLPIDQERGCSEQPRSFRPISKQFATFFGTYTKAINKATSRTGRLFEDRFKRKPVTDNAYFTALITYIHQNPQKHGFVEDYRDWPYSSYSAICSYKPTHLARDEVLRWFDDRQGFISFHDDMADFRQISTLVEGDFG